MTSKMGIVSYDYDILGNSGMLFVISWYIYSEIVNKVQDFSFIGWMDFSFIGWF